ncbi:unnamed protein product [Urochloa humidicola]
MAGWPVFFAALDFFFEGNLPLSTWPRLVCVVLVVHRRVAEHNHLAYRRQVAVGDALLCYASPFLLCVNGGCHGSRALGSGGAHAASKRRP